MMKSKLAYIALAALLLLIGTGFGRSFFWSEKFWLDNYPDIGSCKLVDAATIKLSGPIDDAMYACVGSLLTRDIETITVTSNGGDVDIGRAIGYKISEHPRRLIIDKACLSSCGNYFVPAAARVELMPRSVIGLHGTPDPHMLSNIDMENHMANLVEEGNPASEGLTRILKRKSDRRAKQLTEESKFATYFNVPKGWRHYREAGDADDSWRQHFVEGSDTNIVAGNFMIVEAPMMTSCLPHVEIVDFQETLDATVLDDTRFWASLRSKVGAYRSRGLQCKPMALPQ